MDLHKETEQDKTEISTGIITWDSKPQLSSDLDWGASFTDSKVKTDDFELKWSDDENDKDSDDSDGGISMNIGGKKDTAIEKEEEPEEEEEVQQIDIMAQQLKFVACLKILMEELSTLATGFEVDGNKIYIMKIFYFNFTIFRWAVTVSAVCVARKRSGSIEESL